VYLFVRGARATSQGAWFTRPPRELIESLDLLFQGRPLIEEEVLSGDLA
jgi:exodeoxyribonuclease V beta subunit